MLAYMFSSQISLRTLVGLCRRLSTASEAGIDIRTVLAREVERAHGPLRRHLLSISFAIDQGNSLSEALLATGDFFPALFREMIALGEETGHVDAVLAQLAEHYQNQVNMRRMFLAAIAWPMVQLILAVLLIGFLIWVMGMLREATRNPDLDILGFGLVGDRGLAIYAAFVAAVVAVFWITLSAIKRGLVWTRPIQRLLLRLPVIGAPLRTFALARLAWAMHVTMGGGMDVHRALRLSLRSTQNAYYIDQIGPINAAIASGNSIYEAFSAMGGYPAEFLDTLAVSEQSGRIVESLGHLARQYQDRARAAMAAMTLIGGWLVWMGIAAIIITLIFRLFSFYLNMINTAGRG
jgi:type II secretory pathway component PulF